MSDADRLARVALSHLAEPGDVRVLRLVRQLGATTVYEGLCAHGGLDAVLDGMPDGVSDGAGGAGVDLAVRLGAVRPEQRLEQARRAGIRFVVPGDAEWPTGLDDLADQPALHQRGEVPVGLWVRGPLRLDEVRTAVAVVGARRATTYGGSVAGDLGQDLGSEGWTVVSGAAFGIDQAAHRGALAAGGPTVAVLACGVDRAYPVRHSELLDQIGDQGAVVSEAPPGATPTRVRFLGRNRLIAGLARGTVVVEAAVRSGSLNTAGWAERLSRVVMGVPGPVTSALSQGVHELIRTRAGLLVTSGAEVREAVGESGEHLLAVPRAPLGPRDHLPIRHQQVLDAVPVSRGATVETISRGAGIGTKEAGTALGALARAGLIEQSGAGWRLSDAAWRADRAEERA
ncbi:DNA-processing protein DprA [Nocardioides zeae]|uniref:DNA-processing protein DprA n=1 Tax=Nocardioides imazamoxiresistens TaxID=3231893 RepID=A0ABU3PXF5_9ACTN|nr:DNA-processing protein DprA [Nocardioides zeae]MDT9593869.1 DNA-processing protein DprA [Nocardioides zeae]